MNNLNRLGEIATVVLSNVDKKSKEHEKDVKLCNFVDVYNNWAIDKNTSNNFMIATANDNQVAQFMLKKGQVAITKDSETRDDIGVSTYIADDLKDTLLGYHCALVTPDFTKLNGKFLNAYLHSPRAIKHFSNQASGSGQRYTLTASSILNLPIPDIDLKHQEKIGNFFSVIDRIIENNKKIISELESMAKTIYDYWFLQFDFPDENGKPYKASGGKMIWNEELKREIPEGWEVIELGKLFHIIMGSSPKGNTLNESKEGIEFYQGSTDFGKIFPTERVYTTGAIRYAKANDVLLSVRAPVGDMNIAMNDCCIGRGLSAIRHESSMFALNTLRTLESYFNIYNGAGTTFGALTSDALNEQLVVNPPDELILDYSKIVLPFEKMLRKCENENRKLASLRDFLLPMLMNGQVTFKK